MTITICGSIKFFDHMVELERTLRQMGHTVYMPIQVVGVDYWAEDNSSRVNAKKGLGLINEYMNKIEKSDAILVANITKKDIEHYIGANTFIEIAFAFHYGKKIFTLNPLPDQSYIKDELETMSPIVIHNDLFLIKKNSL